MGGTARPQTVGPLCVEALRHTSGVHVAVEVAVPPSAFRTSSHGFVL